jgi:hypothetical protein
VSSLIVATGMILVRYEPQGTSSRLAKIELMAAALVCWLMCVKRLTFVQEDSISAELLHLDCAAHEEDPAAKHPSSSERRHQGT